MSRWQLQEAKARLSEVIKHALNEGPQDITLRGEPVAVLIPRQDYDRLSAPKAGFVEFMRRSPMAGVALDTAREPGLTREITL